MTLLTEQREKHLACKNVLQLSGHVSYKVIKPGFIFLCLCYDIFGFTDACLVLLHEVLFFSTNPDDWLGRMSPN